MSVWFEKYHLSHLADRFGRIMGNIRSMLTAPVFLGHHLSSVPPGSLVLFPCRPGTLCCGLAGIIAFHAPDPSDVPFDIAPLDTLVADIETGGYARCHQRGGAFENDFLGGTGCIESLWQQVQGLKRKKVFVDIFKSPGAQSEIASVAGRIDTLLSAE